MDSSSSIRGLSSVIFFSPGNAALPLPYISLILFALGLSLVTYL